MSMFLPRTAFSNDSEVCTPASPLDELLLKFVVHEDEDDQDEDDVAEETAEWGAFGFLFTLGVLSFDEAKPRNQSSRD